MLSVPKISENCDLAGSRSVLPQSIFQTAQDSPDDQMPTNPSLTLPESESPQLDQLLSDLEEMKLKYRSEMLDPPLSDSSNGMPDDRYLQFEDLSSEVDHYATEDSSILHVSESSVLQLAEDNDLDDNSTGCLQSHKELTSTISSNDSVVSKERVQDQHPHLGKAISADTPQSEDLSSQSFSDLTPDTVIFASNFSFEKAMALPSEGSLDTFSDECRPKTAEQFSEESLTPEDSESLVTWPASFKPKDEVTLSDEDSSPPGYAKTSSTNNYTGRFSPDFITTEPAKGWSELPERNLANFDMDSSTVMQQGQEELGSALSPSFSDTTEEKSTEVIQDQLQYSRKVTSVEAIQSEDLTSQPTSDLSSDTVECSKYFGFEELMPENLETLSDEDRPRTDRQLSHDSLAPVDSEFVAFQSMSVEPKADITLSNSDEEWNISPGHIRTSADIFTEKYSSLPEESINYLPEIPEEHATFFLEEKSTTDALQSPEEPDLVTSSNDLREATEETKIIEDQLPNLGDPTSVETTQDDDYFSQSFSDLTSDTVECSKYFGFEELMPLPSVENSETSSDEDMPLTYGQLSQDSPDSLTPDEFFVTEPFSVQPKAEVTLSTPDEESNIPPGYAQTFSPTNNYDMPPEYAKVEHSGVGSSAFEGSDPETFFDCQQAASDFSETDELDTQVQSSRDQPQEKLNSRSLQQVTRGVLLSSGSEDYEDVPFVQEPLHHVPEEKKELDFSEASDEEFSLCEASQPPPSSKAGGFGEPDAFLAREITAELGSMSESSDDEFLTTRIVRRRFVIQADEMSALPSKSVTEEKYEDENGHIVVKKVTCKIIRKCVSADGMEREEVSVEGAHQGSVNIEEGDGYSKVVKRTVLKSEGDHTEVTFAECEGFSASNQEKTEGGKVRHVERTTVVEGERTMTHQGDPALASDLPTAKDDLQQALGYISVFSRPELPHVVERETVKEDGTVVRRAHMRKGRTLRQTVVKGAGRRKQVLLEQVDNPRKGSKPNDLKQHLHQLFHRYYQEEKVDTNEDEDKE